MNSAQLLEFVKENEGYSSDLYQDTEGHWTIGYGTLIETISKEEAEWLLQHRLELAIDEAHKRWPYVQDMPDGVRTAIYDMAYNMGCPRLAGFVRMWRALRTGDYETAADEAQDSAWFRQVGVRGQKVVGMIRGG